MPLSEYEQRVLDELEAQLTSDDPSLASSLAAPPKVMRRGRLAAGIAATLAGLAILVVGMVLGQIWLSLTGFAVMFTGAWLALTAPKRDLAAAVPASPPPSGRTKLTDRLEERWDRRHGE